MVILQWGPHCGVCIVSKAPLLNHKDPTPEGPGAYMGLGLLKELQVTPNWYNMCKFAG